MNCIIDICYIQIRYMYKCIIGTCVRYPRKKMCVFFGYGSATLKLNYYHKLLTKLHEDCVANEIIRGRNNYIIRMICYKDLNYNEDDYLQYKILYSIDGARMESRITQ